MRNPFSHFSLYENLTVTIRINTEIPFLNSVNINSAYRLIKLVALQCDLI